MDEIGGNSVGKVPGSFPTELKKKLAQRTQEQARLGPALAQPSLAQAGTRPKPAQAWAQIRPDHMNPTYPPTSPSVERGGLHASSVLPAKPRSKALLPASLASPASPAAQQA